MGNCSESLIKNSFYSVQKDRNTGELEILGNHYRYHPGKMVLSLGGLLIKDWGMTSTNVVKLTCSQFYHLGSQEKWSSKSKRCTRGMLSKTYKYTHQRRKNVVCNVYTRIIRLSNWLANLVVLSPQSVAYPTYHCLIQSADQPRTVEFRNQSLEYQINKFQSDHKSKSKKNNPNQINRSSQDKPIMAAAGFLRPPWPSDDLTSIQVVFLHHQSQEAKGLRAEPELSC